MPVLSPATVANLASRSYEKKGSLPKPRRRSSDAAYHQEHFERLIFNRRAVDGATRDCPVVLALSRPS